MLDGDEYFVPIDNVEAGLVDGPRRHEGWPSLAALLDDVADTLAADDPEPLRHLRPVVDAGRLEWH